LFVKEGWEAEGIELTEVGCEETAARGVKAHQGTINSVDLPEQSFDTILFFHCLEHTVDPRNDLRRAIKLLKPGGQILIGVPNFSSWEARRFGTYWAPLELPRHRTHFTEQGLKKLLESESLSIEKTSTGTPLGSLVNSIRNKRGGETRPLGRIGGLLFAVACVPLLPVSALIGRLGGGCAVLNVAARKPVS
jgi:SAM-dependent methyltransferase